MERHRKYIGKRYVPKIIGVWDSTQNTEYESLSVVLHDNKSYTSKIYVPPGVDIDDEKFWVMSGNYNAQVGMLSQELDKLDKRVNEIAYNIKSFGAKGDGVNDDYEAIQKCITHAQTKNGRVFIPIGVYHISKPLALAKSSITIAGADFKYSVIIASEEMDSMITFDDTSVNDGFAFENFTLEANFNAKYCLSSEKLTHTKINRVVFRKSKEIGLRIGWGWSNDIIECRFQYHRENAIEFVSSSNHLNNIVRCKILENSGYGVVIQSGRNINISDCQIQENKKGGIYHKTLCNSTTINNNYFEQNGLIGCDITNPTVMNIKADVIINGSPLITDMSRAYPLKQVTITNNTHYIVPNSTQTCAYYLLSVEGATVTGNSKTGTNDSVPMVSTYIDNARTVVSDLIIGTNGWNKNELIRLNNIGDGKYTWANTWNIIEAVKSNFITDKFATWIKNYNYNESTLTDSSTTYYNQKVGIIEMKEKGNSHLFGIRIDIALNPELAGKPYYVSAKVKQSSDKMGALIATTSSGRNTPYITADTEWRTITHVGRFPTMGGELISFQLYAGEIGDKLSISMPVVSLIGTPSNSYY